MKLGVGHNDGNLVLFRLVDSRLKAFQSRGIERRDSILLFISGFSILGLKVAANIFYLLKIILKFNLLKNDKKNVST